MGRRKVYKFDDGAELHAFCELCDWSCTLDDDVHAVAEEHARTYNHVVHLNESKICTYAPKGSPGSHY